MTKYSVGFSMFGRIIVEAEDEDDALTMASELLDDALVGFGPEIDGIDYERAEKASPSEQLSS